MVASTIRTPFSVLQHFPSSWHLRQLVDSHGNCAEFFGNFSWSFGLLPVALRNLINEVLTHFRSLGDRRLNKAENFKFFHTCCEEIRTKMVIFFVSDNPYLYKYDDLLSWISVQPSFCLFSRFRSIQYRFLTRVPKRREPRQLALWVQKTFSFHENLAYLPALDIVTFQNS